MTKSQMRIQIAKDVIARLRVGQYKATPGVYVELPEKHDKTGVLEADAKKALDLGRIKSCKVCARGALFLSAVDKFDRVRLRSYDLAESLTLQSGRNAEGGDGLSAFFSARQFVAIECAFEETGWDSRDTWYAAYPSPKNRLDAICRNIIANGGTFVPDKIPRPRKTPLTAKKARA